MIKFFIFLLTALALPSIIKLKSGGKELTIHSTSIQDLHYFSAFADYFKHQNGHAISEFEISSECFDVMPYLIGLLSEFKNNKKLISQFTDYTRLNYCASFYAAPNEFSIALQEAQKEKQSSHSDDYIRVYVKKVYINDTWRTTVGPLTINVGTWKEAEIVALNNGYVKDDYGTDYLIFKKLKQ